MTRSTANPATRRPRRSTSRPRSTASRRSSTGRSKRSSAAGRASGASRPTGSRSTASIPDAPGFFWCAGQGGFGIQTSPAAGLAAALLLGGGARADGRPHRSRGLSHRAIRDPRGGGARCSSASAQASASTRSFSGWPLWPFTQCHSTRCGAAASISSCHSSAFLTGFLSDVRQPLRCQLWIQLGDPVADVDAVGVQLRPGRAASAPSAPRSRPSAPSGCWSSAASPPDSSRSLPPMRRSAPQPPGPGIAAARAVGEDFDFRQLGHVRRQARAAA